MTDEKWARIWNALESDVSDRRGLKWEWGAIDDEVKLEEIAPRWRKIIEDEEKQP